MQNSPDSSGMLNAASARRFRKAFSIRTNSGTSHHDNAPNPSLQKEKTSITSFFRMKPRTEQKKDFTSFFRMKPRTEQKKDFTSFFRMTLQTEPHSQFTIHNSQFTIHNSQFTIHNS